MSVNEPGSIGIPINPDGSDFAIDLNKILTKASKNAKVEVNVKPDISGLASELKKASKSTEANLSIGIKAEFTKSSLADLKTSVKAQFDGFSTKVGSQTYTIKPNIELDVRFTESSLKKLKTSINNTFKTVERDAEGKATKITSPIDLTAEFTQKSLNKLKADVSNTFKRTVEKDGGKTTKVVSPINLQAKFTQGSLAQLKRDVSNTFKKTITNADGSTTKVAIPIKITPELSKFSKENIALVKAKLLQDFGVVKLPVVAVQGVNKVGSITNIVSPGAIAGTEAAAKSTRNLARDLTLVGRAATEGKSSVFSFLGSVSVGQVALTAFSTGVIQATKSFIKFGLESSKQVQSVERVFKGFVGNASVVSKLFGELQDFAAVTPFDLEGLLKSSRTLLGAGFKPTELINSLQDISGAGAQLGVTSSAIERVTIALAKIKGQGKVTQRELRTIFTAFPGFNPIKAIADNIERFGGNTGKALKAVTAGGIKADEAVTALLKGMEKFPGAANALYSQSLTLAGSQETLRDRFQQVARAASDPTLNNLASNYRKAADDFKNQSLTSGATSGITELINAGAKFVPVFGKLAVPALNAFGAALAPVVDTVAEFTADGGGEAFLTAFETGVKILPVFNVGLSTTLTILKPFLPLIELTSKAIGAIPPQLLAMAVGLKLLGSSGGLTKNLFGKAADKLDFKKPFTDINNGIEKVKSGAKTAGTSLITAFNKNGVEQFRRETEKLTGKIENLGAKGYKVYNGPGSFFNGVLPQYTRLQAETDKLTAKTDQFATTGATFGQKVKGSFAAAGEGISNAASSVKSFASSALSSVKSFGIELAIAALVGGITFFVNKAAEAKKVTANIARDAELIGEKLRFDTSAQSGTLAEVNLLENVIKDTEEGAKAFKRLDEGYKKTQFSAKTSLEFLKKFQEANGEFDQSVSVSSGVLDGGNKQTKFSKTLDENIARLDRARKIVEGDESLIKSVVVGSDKEFNKVISDLNLAGQVVRENRNLSSTAVNPENAAKNLKKLRQQYKDSFTAILDDNIKASEDAGNKTSASFVKGVKEEFKKSGDVAGAYEKVSKTIAENAIAAKSLREQLRGVANGSIQGAQAQDILNKAMTSSPDAANEAATALQELATAVQNVGTGIGELSFDSVQAGLGSKGFKALYAQVYNEIQNNPTGVGALIDTIAGKLGLDEAGAKEFAKKIASFKSDLVDEIRKTGEEIGKALPAISDAFKADFKFEIGGISAQTLKDNLKAYVDGVKSFGENINKLKTEFPDLAEKIAALGPAAGGQLAKDLAKNPKLAGDIRASLASAEEVYGKYTKDVTGIVQTNFEKINGFNPGELGAPTFNIKEPDQATIDAAATRLSEIDTQIEAKRQELYKKNKVLKQHGEKGIDVEAAIKDNPLYAGVLEEQTRLQAFIDTAQKTVFTSLNTQAAATATSINTTFTNAKIDEAIQPQIDNITTSVQALPASVNKALVDDPFAYIGTGIKIGTSLGEGASIGFTQTIATTKVVINSAFTSMGTEFANALTTSFTAGLKNLPNAILDPFRTTSVPLNTYLASLNTMSKALGLGDNVFPQIPKFHTGGIIGEKSDTHSGRFTAGEQLIVGKKGEGVLPESTMMKLGKGRFEMLRKGLIGDGLGKDGEEASSYTGVKEVAAINAAKDNYLRQYSSGVIIRNMADAVVTRFAEASIQYVQKATAALFAGSGVTGVIASGAVVDSLLAAKGKPGSYKTLIQAMNGSGLPFGVSSTVRPGAITASGNSSLHSVARAVDFVGTAPQMLQMAKWWTQYAPYLAELIHTPLGYGIKNGKRSQYPLNVLAGHYNHGHVALHSGGFVKGTTNGIIANIGERGQSEIVLPLSQPERMAKLISYAARNGSLGQQGQEAIANALNISGGTSNSNNNNTTVGEIVVKVESGAKDPALRGHIAASQILSTLRGL